MENSCTIIPRAQHNISRNDIHPNALKVLYRLHNAGYSAYLVGGCVRDLLLNKHPKDFDIATDALPEEIQALFRNCRLIGKRFRLAHITFGRDIIEVATFRTHHKESTSHLGLTSDSGMLIRDNVYGSIEDDAWRRDFTVNALYYSIADFSILDYTQGMTDLHNKTIRIIGDPEQRFHEDPVRLLRAIRFAAKLNLTIHPQTAEPIHHLKHLLSHVSSSRLFLEVLKFFNEGKTFETFQLLTQYDLFAVLFPHTEKTLSNSFSLKFIHEALKNTDLRFSEGKTISPAFLFAVFLWPVVSSNLKAMKDEKLPLTIKYEEAIRKAIQAQLSILSIPKALTRSVHEICYIQYRLTRCQGNAPLRLLNHPRFRAAYDLFLIRNYAGENLHALTTWWMKFIAGTDEQREELIKENKKPNAARKRKRKFKPKTNIPPRDQHDVS